ncbi:hypothetical protein WMY93_004594 [Mugilogobius chulae]|uniref:Occludin n=1 Tax=Mugilogobius chulae TaxID=88201 RepID=A0AAW0PRP9_9GOBI
MFRSIFIFRDKRVKPVRAGPRTCCRPRACVPLRHLSARTCRGRAQFLPQKKRRDCPWNIPSSAGEEVSTSNMPSNKHSSRPHSSRPRHSEVSYYPDRMLHYYTWTSPPGVMKILAIIIIIFCMAIIACVASTMAWDYDMTAMGGMGGMMPGYGSYGGSYSGSYGGSYGGTYGSGTGSGYGGYGGYGNDMYMDPKSGKGFIIGVAIIAFIATLVIFIMVVSRQDSARKHVFYLASIIICAILAFLMLIATIVYLVAVNPTAQSSGSMLYNQVLQLCAQYQSQSQAQGIFLNQYLYHYCVVEPQEAIAIVLGFLVVVALIILVVFAAKTRSQIRRWGEHRVLWEQHKVIDGHHTSIGEWPVPPILDEQQRLSYKREFDRDHQEYRGLQTELDQLNQDLAELDRDLDRQQEGSPQFLDTLDELNRLKSLKKTPHYQSKKQRCKYLRSKLSHLKKKIHEYDRRP